MFNNLRELIATMPDEKSCRDYLIKQRWDGKPECPYCGCDKTYVIEGGKRFKCGSKACYSKFSVTVGTIMEASNIPLTKWLMAIYLCTAHKKGISSYQLAKDIGVAQKSAWFMLHRIREKMLPKIQKTLGNIVEADLTFIGGKISNQSNKKRKEYREHKNPKYNKTSVLGMTERQGDTIMKTVPNVPNESERIVRENLERATLLVTDEGGEFLRLNDNYQHHTVTHSTNEYVRGNFHTNSIEGIFSHFKRMVYGIYHQISPKHTQRYLDEFTYRFNSRKLTDVNRFDITMKNLNGRLTYKDLIYTNVEEPEKVATIRSFTPTKKSKPVLQIKDDEVIAQYVSVNEAAYKTGFDGGNIAKAARGERKFANGYKWVYA